MRLDRHADTEDADPIRADNRLVLPARNYLGMQCGPIEGATYGRPADNKAGRCIAEELRLSREMDPGAGHVLEPDRKHRLRVNRTLGGERTRWRRLAEPERRLKAAGRCGIRRATPLTRHHRHVLDGLATPEGRERRPEVLRPLLEVVGHQRRRHRLDPP